MAGKSLVYYWRRGGIIDVMKHNRLLFNLIGRFCRGWVTRRLSRAFEPAQHDGQERTR